MPLASGLAGILPWYLRALLLPGATAAVEREAAAGRNVREEIDQGVERRKVEEQHRRQAPAGHGIQRVAEVDRHQRVESQLIQRLPRIDRAFAEIRQ